MHDRDGSQRRGRRATLALTGMALLALMTAGCGDQLDDLLGWFDEDPDVEVTEGSDADATGGSAAPDRLDCEVQGYPCSWDGVPRDRVAAAVTIAGELSELSRDTWDPDALADALESHEELVEAAIGPTGMWFRLDGAPPMWILSDEAFVREDADDLAAATPPAASAATLTPTTSPPPVTTTALTSTAAPRAPSVLPTPAAVVGEDPSQKSALVLSIYEHQPLFWGAREVAALLEDTRGYAGSVEFLANPEPDDLDPFAGGDADEAPQEDPDEGPTVHTDPASATNRVIGPEHFTGWDAYDVVYVATHGLEICDDDRCWTALSLGAPIMEVPDDRDPEDILRAYGYADEPGVTIAWNGGRVLPVIQGEWLAAQYGGGLQGTLVYITACSSARAGDLPAGLSGGRSVFLGWSNTAFGNDAGPAAVRFFEEATERGVASTTVYDELVADGLHLSQGVWPTSGSHSPGDVIYRVEDGVFVEVEPDPEHLDIDAELLHFAPGTDLRIREVIELQHPETGEPLTGGEMVPLGADGDGPTLPVRVEVDGVLPDQVADFEVELIVNGVTVAEGWRLDADGEQVDEEAWRIEDEVGLPVGMGEGVELTLDARATLPEGGRSQHVVTINPEGYELHLEAELDTVAQAFTQRERVEGSFTLTFDQDTGEWAGEAPADWLTYTISSGLCPGGTRTMDTTSDVAVPRASIDPETGAVELDLYWRERIGGPPLSCGEDAEFSTLSEHEVAVTALILGLGAPLDAVDPGGLPDRLLDFVGPETVRFDDWEPGGTAGGLAYERDRVIQTEGGTMTATFRMELRPPGA